MSLLTRFKFFLWYFGRFQVAMIGYLKPKLLILTDNDIVIRLPLNKRSRNHLHSMYFGALAVGADLAGGFHGFYHADLAKCKISLVFKSFQAQFLRRPESHVYFVSSMGHTIRAMIEETKLTGERVTQPIPITAYVHYFTQKEEVANFVLELSVKRLK